MKSIILILLTLGLAGTGYAQETESKTTLFSNLADYLPEAKLKEHTSSLKWGYAGAGISSRLVHINTEWVNPYGIAYAKLGSFLNDGHEFGGQVGFRYPYHFTGTDQNGYYFGFYAGHLESKPVDGKVYQRLGAGVDLSYVLLDKQRISALSVGIGAAEKIEGRYGSRVDIKPQLQIAYSLSFGVF